MSDKTPELLAPAGGMRQLKAAVRYGADAVYLACDRFGMRARAENFTLDTIADATDVAHDAGVRVYVTLNTLVEQHEIKDLTSYLAVLEQTGVDALIVGDLGVLALAKEHAPSLDLHISTQASILNAQAANMYYELGASRVVLARETRLADIAQIRHSIPDDLELEVFVHGAMCVAYSGRCLLSAAMTGRSGNKGACAQSCRWSYALVEEQRPGEYFEIEEDVSGSYILNSTDLCMIEHLDELKAAGINSFKIEGRNKLALYVATVVGAYRHVLDGGDVAQAKEELLTISHRPYSTGFFYGEASQTPEQDGYIKECVHVATVEECTSTAGMYHVVALCHNAFDEGDVLQAVIPGQLSNDVSVTDLAWLAPADGGKPFVERGDLSLDQVKGISKSTAVTRANRSREHYEFICDKPLNKGDFLRKRIC